MGELYPKRYNHRVEKSAYTVKTPVFEGPLDLLLELVTQRKLFVNDVSLAQVADDFVRYLEEHESAGWRIIYKFSEI